MDNFKVIYQILKYIECSMDYEEFDSEHFTAEEFKISEPRFYNLLKALLDKGYITGIKFVAYIGGEDFVINSPRLTIDGMEYLENNSNMKKIYNILKGIKDITPGI